MSITLSHPRPVSKLFQNPVASPSVRPAVASRWRWLCASLIALVCLASARGEGAYDLRKLTAVGDTFQGSEGQLIFRVRQAAANGLGVVAFTAEYGDPASSFKDPLAVGLFVQSDGAPRLVATLPGGGDGNGDYICAINDRGTIAVARPPGELRVFPAQGPVRTLESGDPAPFGSLSFSTIIVNPERFLGETDEVAFGSSLSDNRAGVFRFGPLGVRLVALQGEPIPDRPGREFDAPRIPRISGTQVVFATAGELFLDDGNRVQTVVSRGQPAPEGGILESIQMADVNSEGRIGFLATDQSHAIRVFEYHQGTLRQILSPSTVPPVPGPEINLVQSLYAGEDGSIYFSAVSNASGGIYRWRSGAISKVVADGDRAPSGGRFEVSLSTEGQYHPIPPLNLRALVFPRPNRAGDLVFEASAGNLDPTRRPFLWTSGEMISLDFDRLPADGSDRVVASISPIHVDDQKRVLALADLCCGGLFRDALFAFQPTGPRRLWLPFLAGGGPQGSLEVTTRLELANPSPYEARVVVSPGGGAEALYPPANLAVAGNGAVAIPSQASGSYRRGYAVLDVEGGGQIQANASVRLFRDGALISQAGVPAAGPIQDAQALIDQSDSADNGLAIANPSATDSAVDLTLSDREGRILGVRTIDLDAGRQFSQVVTEIFDETRDPDFLGVLRMQTPDGLEPPLIASLRQSELLISSVPVAPPPSNSAARSLTGLLAHRPRQVLGDGAGSLAVSDDRGAIRLISREAARVILAENATLPGGEALIGFTPSLLLDFTPQGGLLFAVVLEGNRLGLYRWREERVEKVLVDGDTISGATIRLPLSSFAVDRDSRGRIVVGGPQLVVIDEAPRLRLTGEALIEGSTEAWGPFRRVIAAEDGRVFFQSGKAVGVLADDRIDLVALAGQASSTGGFTPEFFLDAYLPPQGDLRLAVLGMVGEQQTIAIFERRPQGLVKLLAEGEPAPGLPGFFIRNLDAGSLRVNSGGDAIVVAGVAGPGDPKTFIVALLIPAQGDPRVFVADAGLAAASGVAPGADFFLEYFGEPLSWSDTGRLLFTALDFQGGRQVLISDGETVTPVISQGDVFSLDSRGRPILVLSVGPALGFLDDGAALVDATLFDGAKQVTALVAAPAGASREYFFPHAANAEIGGVQVRTKFLLSNPGSATSRVEIDRFNRDGSLAGADSLVLDPGRTRSFEAEDAAWVGWARIRTAGGAISVLARLSLRQNGRLVTETTVPESELRLRATLDTRFASNRQTALAIANPWDQPVEITLILDAGDPDTAREETLVLEARGQRAFFVADLFAGDEESSDGRLLIRAEVPVSMVSLRQEGLTLTAHPID